MTDIQDLRAALSLGYRRPRFAIIGLSVATFGVLVGSLVVPTDPGGRVAGLVLTALLALVVGLFARDLARKRRLLERFLARPEALVWLTYCVQEGPDAQELGTLDLYFDTGEQLRLMLPDTCGEEVFRQVREHCPAAASEPATPELYRLWKESPREFPSRVGARPR